MRYLSLTEAILLKNELKEKIENIDFPKGKAFPENSSWIKQKENAAKEYSELNGKLIKVQLIIDSAIDNI